jgi:hypothetical protein
MSNNELKTLSPVETHNMTYSEISNKFILFLNQLGSGGETTKSEVRKFIGCGTSRDFDKIWRRVTRDTHSNYLVPSKKRGIWIYID